MVGSQLPLPWSVPVCLVPDSCSVLPVLAPFWHANGTARVLVALVLVVFWHWRERALCGWGFILSPSATLRVAGQSPRVKVERPAGRTTLARGLWSARPVLADGEWMDLNNLNHTAALMSAQPGPSSNLRPRRRRALTRGAGFSRAGAGKILPRPRRTVGGEKSGATGAIHGGYGGASPRVDGSPGAGRPGARRLRRAGRWCCCGSSRTPGHGRQERGALTRAALAAREAPSESARRRCRPSGEQRPALLTYL